MRTIWDDRRVPRKLRQFPTLSLLFKRVLHVLAVIKTKMRIVINVLKNAEVSFQRWPKMHWPPTGERISEKFPVAR